MLEERDGTENESRVGTETNASSGGKRAVSAGFQNDSSTAAWQARQYRAWRERQDMVEAIANESHTGCSDEDAEADRSSEPAATDMTVSSEYVGRVLESLPARNRRVIEYRFGLADGQPHTLDEVEREFGITRECIRKIESNVLRYLRHAGER